MNFGVLINFILGFILGVIVTKVMIMPLYLSSKESEKINDIDELEDQEVKDLDDDIDKHIPHID